MFNCNYEHCLYNKRPIVNETMVETCFVDEQGHRSTILHFHIACYQDMIAQQMLGEGWKKDK